MFKRDGVALVSLTVGDVFTFSVDLPRRSEYVVTAVDPGWITYREIGSGRTTRDMWVNTVVFPASRLSPRGAEWATPREFEDRVGACIALGHAVEPTDFMSVEGATCEVCEHGWAITGV